MRTLNLLGPVESITRSKFIVTKLESSKNVSNIIGSIVTDANGNQIGKVIDIIGPINQPYAVIKPRSYAVLSSIHQSTVLFYRFSHRQNIKSRVKGKEK